MSIQLQEFAKQVLFGATIEEKLSFPRDEIIDTLPGTAIKTPRQLVRPKHLALREDGVRANHPSNAKLVDEKERGRLLHFFGNHELLATELMALALLKFPDAPASFRQGLLETLKDEQIHTQIYIHRMKQCGVEFGELPLSDYFWKSVSSMEDPLDYVTRLSLTFEQANLDYSREYKKVFEKVGDSSTASILDRIYRDEIDHVGFGLKWFRRWKAAGKSDWEAYRERLVFPLSPARAKGNIFNVDGRSQAGFDESFISDLQIFNRSRGRTPSILWFNPDAETFANQGSIDCVDPGHSTIQKDLAFLPSYLSRKDDLIILSECPSSEFLRQIQSIGFHLPEIMLCDGNSNPPRAPNISRKVSDLRPWAWTPDSIAFFQDTFESASQTLQPESLWNEKTRTLFSKAWSADWGRKLAIESPDHDWLAPEEVYGKPAPSLDDIIALREHYRSLGYPDLVCKANFGTAAKGMRCILEGERITGPIRNWIEKILEQQGLLIVEPWLERQYDFSVQFEKTAETLEPIAFTRLVNNQRGQFRGIVINGFCRGLDAALTRFLMKPAQGRPRIYNWYEDTVAHRLANALDATRYRGPLGVDAFAYRDLSGELKLKSIVEVNPRFTMGRIAHELGTRNASCSFGFFQIISLSQLRKSNLTQFSEYCENLSKQHPTRLTTETKPRIISGSFPLTDPGLAERFLAVYHVRERFEELPL